MSTCGQIIPRKNGFTVRIFIGRDASGKRIYKNQRVTGTKKDAQKILTAMLRKLDMGELLLNPSTQTVKEYCEYWLETIARQSLCRSTFKNYCHYLRHKVYPKVGKTKLTRLESSEIQAIYNGLTAQGLSPKTVHYTNMVLSKALKHAVSQRLIPSNPCDHVQKPKRNRKEMHAMNEQEVLLFLEAAQGSRFYVYFSLLLATGLRPAEGLALKWQDFDAIRRTLTVVRALEYVSGKVYFKETKTSRSRRTINLHDETVNLLLEYRQRSTRDSDLIFASDEGTPLSNSNMLNRYFKPCLLKAGLAKEALSAKGKRVIVSQFRLYDLRHTHATMLLKANVNPKVVSERLGHASVSLTLDTYSHVLPTIQESAVEALGAALYAQKKTVTPAITN
jgi:integrase